MAANSPAEAVRGVEIARAEGILTWRPTTRAKSDADRFAQEKPVSAHHRWLFGWKGEAWHWESQTPIQRLPYLTNRRFRRVVRQFFFARLQDIDFDRPLRKLVMEHQHQRKIEKAALRAFLPQTERKSPGDAAAGCCANPFQNNSRRLLSCSNMICFFNLARM